MSLRVNLGVAGFVGVTKLGAGSIASDQNLAVNNFYVVQATSDLTLTLPAPTGTEDYTGSVIIVKILSLHTNGTITIDRGTGNIDDDTQNIELDEEGQVISLYYVNSTIGWSLGPATL